MRYSCLHPLPAPAFLSPNPLQKNRFPGLSGEESAPAPHHAGDARIRFRFGGNGSVGGFLQVLSLAVLTLWCLQAAAGEPEFRFQKYTIQEGLSGNWVTALLRDSRDFMWIGTRNGLNCFNGYSFTTFMHHIQDTKSLGGNRILTLMEDKKGFIWIGTYGNGLNRYDRETGRFSRFTPDQAHIHGFNCLFAQCLLETSAGEIWVGTQDHGILIKEKDRDFFRPLEQNDLYLNILSVTSLIQDSRGRIWIGTNGKTIDVTDTLQTKIERIPIPGLQQKPYGETADQVLFEDSDGEIWIGSRRDGAWLYDPEIRRFERFSAGGSPGDIGYELITSFAEPQKGQIWIGTDNGGISVFDKKKRMFSHILKEERDPGALNSNGIYSLYADPQHRVWIGTFDGGVNVYNPEKFRFNHFMHEHDVPGTLSENNVISMCRGKGNTLWVGTDGGGLNRFDPRRKVFKGYPVEDPSRNAIDCPYVTALSLDRAGRLWVAGFEKGISVGDPDRGRWTHFQHSEDDPFSLCSNNVWSILQDSRGTVWIGLMGAGIDRFDEGKGRFVHHRPDPENPEALGSDFITTLFEDSRGRFWIGTEGRGLDRMDRETGRFTHYRHAPADTGSISSDIVNSIMEDHDGTLWIGTENGLNRMDPETGLFRTFYRADGLPDNCVYDVLQGGRGGLWISTADGLCRLDTDDMRFHHITRKPGLQKDPYSQTASAEATDGTLYFGGLYGITAFHPDSIRTSGEMPPVVFTRFEIFNRPVTVGSPDSPLKKSITETQDLELSYLHSVFSISFAALDYSNPEKILYKYIMEGFDPGWTETDAGRRRATYTRLPGGHYHFKVLSTNSDGVWNDKPASLAISIKPPFWATGAFRAISILVMLGIALALHRMRTRRIHRTKDQLAEWNQALKREIAERIEAESRVRESLRDKEILLKEIHHRVKNNMQLIISLLNLQSGRIGDKRLDAVFSDTKRRIRSMALIHEKLYQSQNLSHIPFSEYIRSLVNDVLASYQDACRHIHFCVAIAKVELPITVAVPCGLVINELVSNAFKYAFPDPFDRPRFVHVRMSVRDGCVNLYVRDNGKGVPEHVDVDQAETLGLNLVSILVKDQMKGKLVLDRWRGACFHIQFDLSGENGIRRINTGKEKT
ncbi:hypothetical protein JW906_02790 [bacterium]|nr:hypothetical protein [bacterium]